MNVTLRPGFGQEERLVVGERHTASRVRTRRETRCVNVTLRPGFGEERRLVV